jgi:hypothetical protein
MNIEELTMQGQVEAFGLMTRTVGNGPLACQAGRMITEYREINDVNINFKGTVPLFHLVVCGEDWVAVLNQVRRLAETKKLRIPGKKIEEIEEAA